MGKLKTKNKIFPSSSSNIPIEKDTKQKLKKSNPELTEQQQAQIKENKRKALELRRVQMEKFRQPRSSLPTPINTFITEMTNPISLPISSTAETTTTTTTTTITIKNKL